MVTLPYFPFHSSHRDLSSLHDLTLFYFSGFPRPLASYSHAFNSWSTHSSFLPLPFSLPERCSPCSLTGCFLLILPVSSCTSSAQRSPHWHPKTGAIHPTHLKYCLSLLGTHVSSPRLHHFLLHKMQLYTSLCLYWFFSSVSPTRWSTPTRQGLCCSQPNFWHLAQCLVHSK